MARTNQTYAIYKTELERMAEGVRTLDESGSSGDSMTERVHEAEPMFTKAEMDARIRRARDKWYAIGMVVGASIFLLTTIFVPHLFR